MTTAAGGDKKRKDMLEELMEGGDEEEGMTEEETVDFLLALLVAGYETTSTIMTLAVKFLTDFPHALALLREEQEGIRAKKGDDEQQPLAWSDYKSMPFTQCVINETLRVANIISGVFRRAMTDIHFKGYKIPKGCKVFISFRAVHLDPEYFEDARTFNPWRWQNNEVAQLQQTGGAGVYTPFGGGSRLCPGTVAPICHGGERRWLPRLYNNHCMACTELSFLLHAQLGGSRERSAGVLPDHEDAQGLSHQCPAPREGTTRMNSSSFVPPPPPINVRLVVRADSHEEDNPCVFNLGILKLVLPALVSYRMSEYLRTYSYRID
ncbi:hypothetical protein BHE74_00050504 [Ensete ventricosum]|nr:hypothetical protein BHE74_00050504 [Ensete ventricosum]